MPRNEQVNAIRRYSSEVWEQGNLDAVDEIFTVDRIRHGPDLEGTSEGSEGHKELVKLYRAAFPDLKLPIEVMVGEGDVVLTRWAATGTLNGPMLGAPPTGKPMRLFGFWMHRFEGNKIAEEWATWNTHGMLQQVGVSIP